MKPPSWKIWLSYLYKIPVETRISELHTFLSVTLSKGRYQLSTPHAVYSYGDLYDNFFKVFQQLDWSLLRGDRVLLLGLGLGSIPYMLECSFHKALEYTAVEIDSQIIDLAGKYVTSDLESPMTVYQADAVDFVRSATGQWHMICVDIFVDDVIPGEVQSMEFMENLKSLLDPDGILLYNCLSRTREDIDKTMAFGNRVFFQVFPEGDDITVGGNRILVSNMRFFKNS